MKVVNVYYMRPILCGKTSGLVSRQVADALSRGMWLVYLARNQVFDQSGDLARRIDNEPS